MSQWIPVADSRPAESVRVLLWAIPEPSTARRRDGFAATGGLCVVDYLIGEAYGHWMWNDFNTPDWHVTHWMALPEAPQ